MVILRRIDDQCSYGLQYRTHPRELNDFEMVEIAKSSGEQKQFGDSNAFFTLYNDSYGAAFFVANEEPVALEVTFELELENMQIKGEKEGATEFSFRLAPYQKSSKIIKTVGTSLGNSLAMSYSYSFD